MLFTEVTYPQVHSSLITS